MYDEYDFDHWKNSKFPGYLWKIETQRVWCRVTIYDGHVGVKKFYGDTGEDSGLVGSD